MQFNSRIQTISLILATILVGVVLLYAVVIGVQSLTSHFGAPIKNFARGRSCAVQALARQAPREPIKFSDLARDDYARIKVAVDCDSPAWRTSRLSFHVYDSSGRLLRWHNPDFPIRHEKNRAYGFIRLSLAGLASLQESKLTIKPDIKNSTGAWASKSFFAKSSGIRLHFNQRSIAHHLNEITTGTSAAGATCALRFTPSQPTNLDYDYKQLATHKFLKLHVQTQCQALNGKRLGYHVLDERGQLIAWNAAQHSPGADTDTSTQAREAVFKPAAAAKANERQVLEATLSLPMFDYRDNAPGNLQFVPDVLGRKGSSLLQGKLHTSVLHVDYRLEKLRHLYQITPFLMPDAGMGASPVVYDLYSPDERATNFRASEAFFKKPSHARYDTRRHKLPAMVQGHNWHFIWLTYIAPVPGTYTMHAGFVYDPYIWYSDAFKLPDGRTTYVLRIRWYLLCTLAGLLLFALFLRYAWAVTAWPQKIIFASAALVLAYVIAIPVLLNELGWIILNAAAFVYLVSRYNVAKRVPVMIAIGALFGFTMELYWGTMLQTYMYGVVLSAASQALAVGLLCIVIRRSRWRRAVIACWFLIWLFLYSGVDIYLNFFGEAPRLSVFTYAGQGAAVFDEILGLVNIQQILGICLGLVYVVGLMLSPWLSRYLHYANRRLVRIEA